jgi:charged multivesicular body protein 1
MTAVMDKFEKQFEALDVHAGMLDASMAGATTLSAPEDQIESLIRQVRGPPLSAPHTLLLIAVRCD